MCRGTHWAIDLKARRKDRVLRPRGYQRLDVVRVGVGFRGRKEASTHAYASRARLQYARTKTRTREYLVDAALAMGMADDDPRVLAVIGLAHPENTGPTILKRVSRMRLHEITDPIAAMYVGSPLRRPAISRQERGFWLPRSTASASRCGWSL